MADGVKIGTAQREFRGATLVWKDHRQFLVEYGRPKEIHFRFDQDGICIVSTTVWARAKEMMAIWPTLPRLIEIGFTSRPPTQRVTGLEPIHLGATPSARPVADPRKTDQIRHAGKTARPLIVCDGGGRGQGPPVLVPAGLKVLPKIELVRAK